MMQLVIAGYEREAVCEHCGRRLVHGIRMADGRTVGATCLDRKLTLPKVYQGKRYRMGSAYIIRAAKVVQLYPPSKWDAYGVSQWGITFDGAT